MAKNNFYGVKVGRKIGVYSSWDEAKEEITGFPNAKYKGFKTEDEARAYVFGETIVDSPAVVENKLGNEDLYYVYVDGSYKEATDSIGYGVVFSKDNETPLFCDCGRVVVKDTSSRQVIGEIQAVIRTIQLCKANNIKNIHIMYDYIGIENWITGEWKANKPTVKRYVEYFRQHIQGINYKFIHTPAHTGIVLNELADTKAKAGCEL